MKQLTRLLLMMLTISASLVSCDDVTGSQDNPVVPTPTPTPTPAPTYASDLERPLTFEAAMDGVKVTFKFKSGAKPDYRKVEYSLDQGATWTALKRRNQAIILEKAGDIVMFRGDNPTYNGDAQFVTELVNAKARGITRGNTSEPPLFNVSGNITSLIESSESLNKKNSLSGENAGCYKNILRGTSVEIVSLDGRSKLVFSAEQLAPSCYEGALAETPIKQGVYLPAPTLVEGGYVDLFRGCSKLEGVTLAANSVEAGTAVYDCVAGMLMDTATDLPADVKPKLTFVDPEPGVEDKINVEKRPVTVEDISGSIMTEVVNDPNVADRLSDWDVVFIDENGNEQQVEPAMEQQVEPEPENPVIDSTDDFEDGGDPLK